MSDIRLDVAERNAQCDTCPARNYGPAPTTTIYTLYIGAGYRMPAFICPDCKAKVAAVLGVSSRIAIRNGDRPYFVEVID